MYAKFRHLSMFTVLPAIIWACACCVSASSTEIGPLPTHYSKCSFDSWLRGWCVKAGKRRRDENASLLKYSLACIHDDFEANSCRARRDLLQVPKSQTCRQLARILKWPNLHDCDTTVSTLKQSKIKRKAAPDGDSSGFLLSDDTPAENGTAPEKLSDLARRWRHGVKYCDIDRQIVTSGSQGAYPTKEFEEIDKRSSTPEPCNDGDMLLFNGLLCASGEGVACDAARDSQEQSMHQWWRSPGIRKEGVERQEEPNLNSDQVLGLLLYFLQRNRGEEFRHWIEWVRSRGTPKRFCSLNGDQATQCTFRPTDCSLILLVGSALGEQGAALSLCNPGDALGLFSPVGSLPRLEDAFNQFDAAVSAYKGRVKEIQDFQKIIGTDLISELPIPPIPELSHSRQQAQEAVRHFQNLQDLLLPSSLAGRAAAYFFASAMITANAGVAGLGQSAGASASAKHLAATSIFLLKKFNVPDPALQVAANKLWNDEPDNAFFAFLVLGKSKKVEELVRKSCPADPDTKAARYQWMWERSVSADAASETMYWDCVFAYNLYSKGLQPYNFTLGDQISELLPPVARSWNNFKEAKSEMEETIKTIFDARAKMADATDALKAQLEYLKNLANALAKKSLPAVNPDGSVTIPPPPGNPGPTVHIDPHGNPSVSLPGGFCVGPGC